MAIEIRDAAKTLGISEIGKLLGTNKNRTITLALWDFTVKVGIVLVI